MEEMDILDELEVSVVPKRSNFLMVLCILTWVGSGLSIIVYGYLYLMLGQLYRTLESFDGGRPDELNWFMWQYLIGAIAPVFCILGAVLMWKLKRVGFYVYLLGQLTPIILSFYTWLIVTGKYNSETVFFAVLVNIIPIGFIIMYAINIRQLKR
ncbi:MAG: hypothetical protein A3D31_06315 [Candidatus Fluviicola riflensis]|nr:MAG: hypothetical protein CHH17_08700 [Candidatus Fluviicola riflensis]OGS79577.1 MAG: hypothetical protein A3D31_06315 [Candidatus Fluviicola riflensis]OGS87008.1 MAG: hypothetical protein A2724_05775 [Fluviicola sp. RIFCSPHIGHO2_01_FULL_43_53]OGS89799.1 MAG: hypothetical protein A3E30_02520 [Fluviicola sp. RIFCSPHIGHO2_12_FULL_43_24]